MPLRLPLRQQLNLIANVPAATGAGRHDHVDAISETASRMLSRQRKSQTSASLSPLEGFHFQQQMQIDVIVRVNGAGRAEVSATCRLISWTNSTDPRLVPKTLP